MLSSYRRYNRIPTSSSRKLVRWNYDIYTSYSISAFAIISSHSQYNTSISSSDNILKTFSFPTPSYSSCRNNLVFLRKHTTSYLDVVMLKYITMLENIRYDNRNSLSPFTQMTCWLHICMQLCLFYFRMQHTTDYNNAQNVSIINDAIITVLQLTIHNCHLVFSDVFKGILTLLNQWQIDPGRKQSVTWLYFVFTIMLNALLPKTIVQSPPVDAHYITIFTKISSAFPMLSRNTHIHHVSTHVQNLLRVHENILNFGTMMSTYTCTSILHNGYLCE